MKKILLIHGWDYKNYSAQTKNINVWENRKNFVQKLQKKADVKIITLPGFCGEQEPDTPWKLEDFVEFVEKKIKDENFVPDYILGYSFGGAVALMHKLKYNKNKIILVSPAICRRYKTETNMHKRFKIFSKFLPNNIINGLRDLYISYVVKNPFYSKGTYFLKKTYLNIVGIDLSLELQKLNPADFKIIFGELDTATPPSVLLQKAPMLRDNVVILANGTHDIANTNTQELIAEIEKFIQ